MRISFINPNLLEGITPKQQKLWGAGKFIVLPVVHSVRKATDKEIEAIPLRYRKPIENPGFIGIVWKQ